MDVRGIPTPPGALEEALRMTDMAVRHEDGEWVAISDGFPWEWHGNVRCSRQA